MPRSRNLPIIYLPAAYPECLYKWYLLHSVADIALFYQKEKYPDAQALKFYCLCAFCYFSDLVRNLSFLCTGNKVSRRCPATLSVSDRSCQSYCAGRVGATPGAALILLRPDGEYHETS